MAANFSLYNFSFTQRLLPDKREISLRNLDVNFNLIQNVCVYTFVCVYVYFNSMIDLIFLQK